MFAESIARQVHRGARHRRFQPALMTAMTVYVLVRQSRWIERALVTFSSSRARWSSRRQTARHAGYEQLEDHPAAAAV